MIDGIYIKKLTDIVNIVGKVRHPNVQYKPTYDEYQTIDYVVAIAVLDKIEEKQEE